MRLLFVARRYPDRAGMAPAGRVAAFARLVGEAARHADVRLVAGWTGAREELPPGALGVDLRGGGVLAHLQLARAIAAVSARHRPDVIVAGSPDLPAAGRRSVVVVRDRAEGGWEPLDGLADLVERARLRRWARVVVPTEAARADLRASGLDRWAVHRIPEGWGEWGEPAGPRGGGPLVLACPGRLHPAKGVHLAIDAVARLGADEKARIRLDVVGPVGDARYVDQLRVMARGQPVAFHPDAPPGPRIAAADVVVYPTCAPEGFADGVLAGMAQGKPVIWADHPGVRETAAGAGIPVPPGDVPALREVLRRALGGELELGRIGEEGREIARARYDWGAVWPRWAELLESVAR